MEAQGFSYVENFSWIMLDPSKIAGKFFWLINFVLEIESRGKLDLEGAYRQENGSLIPTSKKTLLIFRRKPHNYKS